MTASPVRLRLAPSPTGFLHVATLRLALYNYLFIQQQGGQFVLRIEDTDQARTVEGAIEAIYEALEWAQIPLDESPRLGGPYAPYIQSERTPRHQEVAHKLVDEGKAYRCFCTKERLAELRDSQEKHGLPPQYDRKCRNMTETEVQAELDKGTSFTIRFKMPLEGDIVAEDLVRGKIIFPAKDQDDTIILKSDGMATYHLAAMVDDADMKITHVLRGEEWLPSYPKHIEIIKACGFPMPAFVHTTLILNEDRTKLSKRKGPVAMSNFIEAGYLREALINFLMLVGWTGPETNKEIYSMEELIKSFSFDRLTTAPAVFKYEKLDWFNGHYIRAKSTEDLEKDLVEYLEHMKDIRDEGDTFVIPSIGQAIPKGDFRKMVQLAQQKMVKMNEFVPGLAVYFSLADYDNALFLSDKMKVDEAMAKTALDFVHPLLVDLQDWNLESIKTLLLEKIAAAGYKNGQILWPLRVALTGLPFSPGAFEMADILGKEETLHRLETGMSKL